MEPVKRYDLDLSGYPSDLNKYPQDEEFINKMFGATLSNPLDMLQPANKSNVNELRDLAQKTITELYEAATNNTADTTKMMNLNRKMHFLKLQLLSNLYSMINKSYRKEVCEPILCKINQSAPEERQLLKQFVIKNSSESSDFRAGTEPYPLSNKYRHPNRLSGMSAFLTDLFYSTIFLQESHQDIENVKAIREIANSTLTEFEVYWEKNKAPLPENDEITNIITNYLQEDVKTRLRMYSVSHYFSKRANPSKVTGPFDITNDDFVKGPPSWERITLAESMDRDFCLKRKILNFRQYYRCTAEFHPTLSPLDFLTKFKNLEIIDLSDCNLESVPFPLLTKLETLWLNNCLRLSNIRGLSNCANLTALSLNFNSRCSLNPIGSLKELTKLQYLSLKRNYLTEDFSPILSCKDLKFLYLDGSTISSDFILNNPKLELFSLENCQPLNIEWLQFHTNLKALNLNSGCDNITNLNPLQNCTKLDLLSLRASKFNNLDCLEYTPNLKLLDLSFTNGLIDITGLRFCTNLVTINLQNCPNINNDNFVVLTDLNSLKFVYIDKIDLIPEAVRYTLLDKGIFVINPKNPPDPHPAIAEHDPFARLALFALDPYQYDPFR